MTVNRQQWEAQRHWNEPFPPWRLATWRERTMMAGFAGLMIAFGAALLFAVLMVVALVVDDMAQRRQDRDLCLKGATNGYDIRKCD